MRRLLSPNSVSKHQGEDPPPPPPPPTDVWSSSEGMAITYLIRTPWQWVMRKVKKPEMTEVETAMDLPSAKLAKESDAAAASGATPATPATRRRRQKTKDRVHGPSALKIEISDPQTGHVHFAVHGTSAALDGIEDKDDLVRTMQRCRCDHLNLCPPSILINWDVTEEECANVIGNSLPALPENKSEQVVAVLKEPMGSQGKGIYFVKNVGEIHKVIDEHRKRAQAEPDFLDNLIEAKNRIPSWVLQAEVVPPLLIHNRRKFHVRTYLVAIEAPHLPDLVELYIYNRHELRIAGVPVGENDTERDPRSHITNGALSNTTERVVLNNEPELASRHLKERIETFVAETFATHLLPDISRRVGVSLRDDDPGIKRFVIAGLDLMVTESNRIYLLEANVHPAAPPEAMVDEAFSEHLTGFIHDLVELVVGNPSPNFLSARKIVVDKGL